MLLLLSLELGTFLLCLQGGFAAPTPKAQDVHFHLNGFTKGKKIGSPGQREQPHAFRGETGGMRTFGAQVSERQSARRPLGTGMRLQEAEEDSADGSKSVRGPKSAEQKSSDREFPVGPTGIQSSVKQSTRVSPVKGMKTSEKISGGGLGVQSSMSSSRVPSGMGMQSSQRQSFGQIPGTARRPPGMGMPSSMNSGMGIQSSQRQSFGETPVMGIQPSGSIPARGPSGIGMQSSMNSGMGIQSLEQTSGSIPARGPSGMGMQSSMGSARVSPGIGMQYPQRKSFGQSPTRGMEVSAGGHPSMGIQSLARQSAVIPQAAGKKSFDRFSGVPQSMGMQSSIRQSAIMSPERMPSVPQSMGMQSPPQSMGMQSIVMQSNGMSPAKGKQSSVKKTGSGGQESDRQAPGRMAQQPLGHWEWVKD